MDLELDEQLQKFLDDSSVTPEMLRYAARLQIATDELKKHEELKHIKLTNLSEQTAIKLRMYAKCIGITYAHWVSKKEDLCQMIMNRHAELSQVPGTEQTAMVTESTTPPEQRPLKIGEPKAYDTEEYFDLRIVQNVYSDYPVEFIEKNKRSILKHKTMETFFCNVLIVLFLEHFKCFKLFRNDYYQYNGEEWVPVFVNSIDEFVLRCYERVESVARQISNDLSLAFRNMDITNRNIILKQASIALKAVIKKCT